MKRFAAIELAIAIVIQVTFEVFTIGFIAVLLRADRWKWLTPALGILIGLNFGLAVGDRFGLLGHHGSPGVSWGDFGHFVAYTRQVNSFLPASFAPFLAVAASPSR